MSRRNLGAVKSLCLVVVLALVACSGQESDTDAPPAAGNGADSPVEAVEVLVAAVNVADFPAAAGVAVPGQAALAALAEGATVGEVARALVEGDQEIAANFWAGFAQGAGTFLAGEVTAVDGGTVTQGDVEFHTVIVTPEAESDRTVLVREWDGYRIDLFASFGAGLADKMIAPVERLLQAQTNDARLVMAELQGIVPSLLVAATLPGTTSQASQNLFSLIEVITRVS